MRLNDIHAENSFKLRIQPSFGGEALKSGVGFISPDATGQRYTFRSEQTQQKIILKNTSTGMDLNFHLKRGNAHIAQIDSIAKDGSGVLKVIFFNGDLVEMGEVEVGIDERIETTAKRSGISFRDTDSLGGTLETKCNLSVGKDTFFLLLSGPAIKLDFDEDNQDTEQATAKSNVPEKLRAFSLYGDRVRIPVEKRKLEDGEEIYFATKAIFKEPHKLERAIRLARGCVTFSDYTKTGRIRALAAGAMSQLTSESGSYLKQWDEYGAIEGEMLLAKAQAIGRIDYHGTEKTKKGVKFFVPTLPHQLSEGDEIEITSIEPAYISNPDIDWADYSSVLESEFSLNRSSPNNDSVYGKIISLSKTSIEINLPAIPAKGMFLILSINGDKIQIERRMKARSAVLEGRSANPLLGLIIEEGGVLPDIQRVTKLKPLTAFVKNKIFSHPPTLKQIEAIDAALNTPDIALVQGPPGTGKTTVVTAILERLNEEYDKTQSVRGQILVSGFQHDAVENIISRLSINALPAVKFGKRSSDSEFTKNATTEKINNWCIDLTEKIRAKNPQIAQTEEQIRLGELFKAYSLSPSKTNTVALLNRILGLPRDTISSEVTSEAQAIIDSLQVDQEQKDSTVINKVRALRVSQTAFEDDGAARAIALLDSVGDDLSDSELRLLGEAAHWRSGKILHFLPELRQIKESLIYKYLPPPDFRSEKPRDDVLKLVGLVSQFLAKNLNAKNKRDAIVADFLHELEDNPDGVREAIEDYNFVYAATTQQSVGKHIINSKNKFIPKSQRPDLVKYDTVIIDEAARTSPRDLLIPMSQAEKRIILVGDHRQLPHVIDEEVARLLENEDVDGSPSDVDFVKKSMFEYLFNRLKKLEEKDSVTRTVTLDAQYRTHPLLGEFISDNFYKKYNEAFRSPLSEEHFEQNLDGIEDKSAVWIDVASGPGDRLEKQSSSKSRYRVSEARAIAKYLKKWLQSKAGKNLSFGVISFYKAQVYEVYRALEKYGITERAQDGSWLIKKKFSSFKDGSERLRIGTVDAFQGMEFDIVFLSMVRSEDVNDLPRQIPNEKQYIKKQRMLFGHLMSDNRLCVSMSRQKRALVIVGDRSLAISQIAEAAIPALKNFAGLCSEQGTVL